MNQHLNVRMTREQAVYLRLVLHSVGGLPDGPRGQMDALENTLANIGVPEPTEEAYELKDGRIKLSAERGRWAHPYCASEDSYFATVRRFVVGE